MTLVVDALDFFIEHSKEKYVESDGATVKFKLPRDCASLKRFRNFLDGSQRVEVIHQ